MRVVYSDAQQAQAVRLYWKLGSATQVIRRLGYPKNRQTLLYWIKQRHKNGRPIKANNPGRSKRRVYTAALRRQVVDAVLVEGMSVAQAATKYDVLNREAIYRWLSLARMGNPWM